VAGEPPQPGTCRACRQPGDPSDLVLDLGSAPAADRFPRADEPSPDPAYPLSMWCCRRCSLVQLTRDDTRTDEPRAVEPQVLVDQARAAVRQVLESGLLASVPRTAREFPSPHGGSWLTHLDWPVASDEVAAGVVLDSFGMMHETDQAAAVRARADALAPDGVLLLQFHSLEAVLAGRQWQALRHGHFAYYSLHALTPLLAGAGLELIRTWDFPLYGGTVLVAASRGAGPAHPSVATVRRRELAAGVTSAAGLKPLQGAADTEAGELRASLQQAARDGRRVYAYAAASRSVALLDRAGVGATLLRGVADASPAKQGRCLPSSTEPAGGRIPIISPDELVAADPDDVLLLLPDLGPEVAQRYPSLADRLRLTLPASAAPAPPAPPAPSAPSAPPARSFDRSNAAQQRLHDLVPGGAHTYARGPDQYPEQMAPVLTRGLGARVWDVDGNCFVEYGMGLRSVTLGHAFPPVVAAVAAAAAAGTSFSRPTALELAAAEDFLTLVPGAEMVKFAKNGSDVTTAAIKLARAATGRDVVALADQPFYSVDDWFIGGTAMNAGIPAAVRHQIDHFAYNDLASLEQLFDRHDGQVAAVLMEAATATAEPAPGYLEAVRALCDRHGTVLVFDEMITGFRWAAGGAQSVYGVTPDLSCWGKAMGNGVAISALAGRRELMELGGLRTTQDRVFLLSTTHGPETTGLAAFRAVAQAYRESDPVAAMQAAGERLAAGVAERAAAAGLAAHVGTVGRPACLVYWTRDREQQASQAYRTVFIAGLLQGGVLGQSFVTSAAHTETDLDLTLAAVEHALVDYRRALEDGVETVLHGRPVAPALRRTAAPRQEPAVGSARRTPPAT